VVVLLKTVHNRTSKGVSNVRQGKGRRMEPERGPGEHGFYRNGRQSPSVSAGRRALIRAAWWLSGEIGRAEMERRGGLFVCAVWRRIRKEITEN
jgi:hypothetical protein